MDEKQQSGLSVPSLSTLSMTRPVRTLISRLVIAIYHRVQRRMSARVCYVPFSLPRIPRRFDSPPIAPSTPFAERHRFGISSGHGRITV